MLAVFVDVLARRMGQMVSVAQAKTLSRDFKARL